MSHYTTLNTAAVLRCPGRILNPAHYRADGSCKCKTKSTTTNDRKETRCST